MIWTTWPRPSFSISATASPRDVEEPGRADGQDGGVVGVVGLRVFGERLGDEDAGVVDERVDAPEPRHAFGDRALGRPSIGDVAADDQDIGVIRRADRTRRRRHSIVAVAIRQLATLQTRHRVEENTVPLIPPG